MADNDDDSSNTKPSAANAKITADLSQLVEKLDEFESLCPTTQLSKAHSPLVGFLEACAPRMVELVEAAAQGVLSEPVLMQCLEVNDRLIKCMKVIEGIELVEDGGLSPPPAAALLP